MLGVVDYKILFEHFSILFYRSRGQLTCVKVALTLIFYIYLLKIFSYFYLILLDNFKN